VFDGEAIKRFAGNGLYHIVYQIKDEVQCYDCGNRIRADRYRAVDGTIEEVSETILVISSKDGEQIALQVDKVIRIETYHDPEELGVGRRRT
jgi:hypothetical protein